MEKKVSTRKSPLNPGINIIIEKATKVKEQSPTGGSALMLADPYSFDKQFSSKPPVGKKANTSMEQRLDYCVSAIVPG